MRGEEAGEEGIYRLVGKGGGLTRVRQGGEYSSNRGWEGSVPRWG